MGRGFEAFIAALTIASLVGVTAAHRPVYAQDEVTDVSGKVLAFDGITPTPDVVVSLTDRTTGESFDSRPSDVQGRYRIPDVPDGEYAISIKTAQGTFDLPTEVVIAGGQPSAITVILPEDASEALEAGAPDDGARGRAVKWIAVASAGALLLVALLRGLGDDDDEDRDASPSAP